MHCRFNENTALELTASIPFKEMSFLMVVFLSFCYVSFAPETTSAQTYDVTSYGAIGDGNTDDFNAFSQAWADLCRDNSPNPTLIIPSAKTFLISPVAFEGPCGAPRINIKLLGNITAPKTLDGWKGCAEKGYWIYFTSVQQLTIDGPGKIDGQGSVWWGKEGETSCNRPSALLFDKCDGLRVRGTKHINSPMLHIGINGCNGVDIGNLHIFAPGDSPNTDGFDIGSSSHVNIHDSTIQTGDDCVAIKGSTYDINITGLSCGPGHGISIGSLGNRGAYDTVDQVRIEYCNITGTMTGLRIKTVPYGRGYVRRIVYQNIRFTNAGYPILIDQHYCLNSENADCSAPPTAPAVKVSDVSYTNIYGSSATKQAITFSCSERFKCTKIKTNEVAITGDGEFAYCENTKGKFIATTPPVNCH